MLPRLSENMVAKKQSRRPPVVPGLRFLFALIQKKLEEKCRFDYNLAWFSDIAIWIWNKRACFFAWRRRFAFFAIRTQKNGKKSLIPGVAHAILFSFHVSHRLLYVYSQLVHHKKLSGDIRHGDRSPDLCHDGRQPHESHRIHQPGHLPADRR